MRAGYLGWAQQHLHIITDQNHAHPLSQMSDSVTLIPPHHPGQLAPQLGERLQGHLVPAPECVTARGMNSIPSAAQRSLYYLSLAA